MSAVVRFAILVGALILGSAGAVLAAKVAPILFWICWIPALGLVAFFIWKSTPCCKESEAPSASAEPPAESPPAAE